MAWVKVRTHAVEEHWLAEVSLPASFVISVSPVILFCQRSCLQTTVELAMNSFVAHFIAGTLLGKDRYFRFVSTSRLSRIAASRLSDSAARHPANYYPPLALCVPHQPRTRTVPATLT
jgi:hypothetical protein